MIKLEGTFRIELSPFGLQARRDVGMQDTAIIHESLENLLNQLDPATRKSISFSDCEIKESKEGKLPF